MVFEAVLYVAHKLVAFMAVSTHTATMAPLGTAEPMMRASERWL